jgi:hypothetical protein
VAGGALYATSSASYRSFGGGMSSGSGASGMGAVQAPRSEMSVGASSVSIPSVPMPSRGLIAMGQSAGSDASLASQAAVESVQGIRSISGRKNAPGIPGIGNTWDNWLNSLGDGSGFLYWDDKENRYYDMDLLQQAFEEAKKNGQLPGWTWQDFLDYFFNNEEVNSHHFVPVGEPWVLLAMALGYALVMIIKAWVNKCKTAPMA